MQAIDAQNEAQRLQDENFSVKNSLENHLKQNLDIQLQLDELEQGHSLKSKLSLKTKMVDSLTEENEHLKESTDISVREHQALVTDLTTKILKKEVQKYQCI